MSAETTVSSKLNEHDIILHEAWGQHFLIDDRVIGAIRRSVAPRTTVIEVGSGIGHVTEAIAEVAHKVIGIEIDTRFQPVLEEVAASNSRIRFVYTDALRVDYLSLVKPREEFQIVANLPFHITEPFLGKLVDLPFESAVLLLGDKAAEELMVPERDPHYGKLSLIAQTFFNIQKVCDVPRESFYPEPRTDAVLLELTPKEKQEIQSNTTNYIFAYLIRRAGRSGLVVNELKQALVDAARLSNRGTLSKRAANKRDRAEVKEHLKYVVSHRAAAREDVRGRSSQVTIASQADALKKIEKMRIEPAILTRPFFSLDNQDIQRLVAGIRRQFG